MATGFPCDIPGELSRASLPGYLNMQWRTNWGMTQSKPSTTPRQQRMPTVSWGDIIPLGGPRFSRSLGFLGVNVVNLWVLCSSSSSVCSLQSPQGISDWVEGLGPDVDFAR